MFEQLVLRMLEKDPRNRPPVAEVAQQLQYMRSQPDIAGATLPGTMPNAQWTPMHTTPRPQTAPQGVPITPPSTMQQSGVAPAKSRTGLVIAIVAIVMLAAGGALAFVLMNKKTEKKPEVIAQAGSAQVAPAGSAQVETPPVKTEPVKTTEPPAGSDAGSAASEVAEGSATADPVKPPEKAVKTTKTTKVEPPKTRLATVAVTIAGAPRGAVFVDGKLVAREISNISLELAPGEHRIRVESPGHKPDLEIIHVESGAKKDLKITLKKKSINAVHDPFAD
jgi:flagellar basal body-associated protein FliL